MTDARKPAETRPARMDDPSGLTALEARQLAGRRGEAVNTINRMTDNRPALFALWYLLTFGALLVLLKSR